MFGLAAVLPHQYMGALMTGQGLGGLVVAVLNVVSLAANGGSSNVVAAAFMFFIISVVILLGCLGVCDGASGGDPRSFPRTRRRRLIARLSLPQSATFTS